MLTDHMATHIYGSMMVPPHGGWFFNPAPIMFPRKQYQQVMVLSLNCNPQPVNFETIKAFGAIS